MREIVRCAGGRQEARAVRRGEDDQQAARQNRNQRPYPERNLCASAGVRAQKVGGTPQGPDDFGSPTKDDPLFTAALGVPSHGRMSLPG